MPISFFSLKTVSDKAMSLYCVGFIHIFIISKDKNKAQVTQMPISKDELSSTFQNQHEVEAEFERTL